MHFLKKLKEVKVGEMSNENAFRDTIKNKQRAELITLNVVQKVY
jgi:hypothetical protein